MAGVGDFTEISGAKPIHGAHVGPFRPPKPRRPPKPKAPKPPKVVDPFSQYLLSDAQMQANAQQAGQAILGPLLQQIKDAYAQRSASGTQAIAGLTNQLGALFSGVGPAEQAAYNQARTNEGQIAGSLATQLGTFGQNLQGEQNAQLALQGAPAGLAQQVGSGQTAQGAANANYAKTSAGLEMLNTQGAAAGAYGAKLPGIAGLTGLQNERNFQGQLNTQMASELRAAQAQAAQAVASAYQHMQDLKLQAIEAKQSGAFKADQLASENAYRAAQLQYKQDLARWNKLVKQQQIAVSRQNAATARVRAREAARHNRTSESQQAKNERDRNARAAAARRAAAKRKAGKGKHGDGLP